MSVVKIKNNSTVKTKHGPRLPRAGTIKNTLVAVPRNPDRQGLIRKFTEALYDDFDAHGAEAIKACRVFTPDVYVRVIANLMPREVKVESEASLTNAELEHALLRYLAGDLAKDVTPGEGRPSEVIEGKAAKEGEK